MKRFITAIALSLGLMAALAACSGETGTGSPVPVTLTPADPTPTVTSEGQVQVVLASSDLTLGPSRFTFGVVGTDGALITHSPVAASFYKVKEDKTGEFVSQHPAMFRAFGGEAEEHNDEDENHREVNGVYAVEDVVFDTPGLWGLRVEVSDLPGGSKEATVAFEVKKASSTIPIGAPAPASRQEVARDVNALSDICTRTEPLLSFHEQTVKDALDSGRPTLVAFTTPAFCETRLCGPVLEEVVGIASAYEGRVNFIHIEPYRLDKIRNEGTIQLAPTSLEWGLPTEPWVFIVDVEGRIAAKFEGVVTMPELRNALDKLLGFRGG